MKKFFIGLFTIATFFLGMNLNIHAEDATALKSAIISHINVTLSKIDTGSSKINSIQFLNAEVKKQQTTNLSEAKIEIIKFQTRISNSNDTATLNAVNAEYYTFVTSRKDLVKNAVKESIVSSATEMLKSIKDFKTLSDDMHKVLNETCNREREVLAKAFAAMKNLTTQTQKLEKDLKAKNASAIKQDFIDIANNTSFINSQFVIVKSACDKD